MECKFSVTESGHVRPHCNITETRDMLCVADTHGKELPGGYGKLTNILNPRSDFHSASSSFPALNDRYSPLPPNDERHSPLEVIRKQISSDSRFDWFQIKVDFV